MEPHMIFRQMSKRTVLALLASTSAFVAEPVFAVDRQDGWRWCSKCQGLWFSGKQSEGVCPNGGGHVREGSVDYSLVVESPDYNGQHDWRWCSKCQGLWYSANPSDGVCPGGGAHTQADSPDYALGANSGQHGWRWCSKCQGLWFSRNQSEGVCPNGGGHSLAGSINYGIDSSS
jgi:hypothetical protein